MRLAVLLDPVGEGTKTPILGLGDGALAVGEDLGEGFAQRLDLGCRQVLSLEEDMLV